MWRKACYESEKVKVAVAFGDNICVTKHSNSLLHHFYSSCHWCNIQKLQTRLFHKSMFHSTSPSTAVVWHCFSSRTSSNLLVRRTQDLMNCPICHWETHPKSASDKCSSLVVTARISVWRLQVIVCDWLMVSMAMFF